MKAVRTATPPTLIGVNEAGQGPQKGVIGAA
jgi:hypothetical protein